jgi:UDP-N-acetylmuramyl pentapeptide phosphotransferase/UDP-N-acetylglucosamine-1-phosphate transferase
MFLLVIAWALTLLLAYWVIRLAVRHALADERKAVEVRDRSQAPTPGSD